MKRGKKMPTGTGRPGRSLCVVADDGGVDAARDEGILACVDAGTVRTVAVLANGAHLDGLAAALRERPGLSVVLHLNLTEGPALAGPSPTLTDGDGRFPGDKREVWRRAHEGGIDPAAVAREAAAQCARLREAGLDPVGINGHNHVHVLPGIREGVLGALEGEREIRWVRIPAEAAPPPGMASVCEPAMPFEGREMDGVARRLLEAGHPALAALRTLAAATIHRLPGRLRFPDAFLGCAFASGGGLDLLAAELREARGAVVELMVHPGRSAEGSVPFSADPARDREREILCSEAFREAVRAAGLEMRGLGDLPWSPSMSVPASPQPS